MISWDNLRMGIYLRIRLPVHDFGEWKLQGIDSYIEEVITDMF